VQLSALQINDETPYKGVAAAMIGSSQRLNLMWELIMMSRAFIKLIKKRKVEDEAVRKRREMVERTNIILMKRVASRLRMKAQSRA
jgi:hypothetical protein